MARDFGSAFIDAYTAVRNSDENIRRGDLLRNADVRAQQEHEWKKEDIEEMKGLGSELAADSQAFTASMAKLGEAARGIPQATGLQPPEGVGPPTADGQPAPAPAAVAVKRPTYDDYINAAREHTSKITPKLIKVLSKAHPLEAAKLALGVSDTVMQDKMIKTSALAGMLRSGLADPAIPKLLEELNPSVVPGSYHPGPPDASGNHGYGQFTEKLPDGSTREVALTPGHVDMMLSSVLSAPKMLEEIRAGKEQERKGAETTAQVETWKKTRDLAEKTFDENVRQFNVQEPERKARTAAALTAAGANASYHKGMEEDRALNREMKKHKQGMDTLMTVLGIKADVMGDVENPQRNKFFDTYAGIDSIAKENKLDLDQGTMVRLAKVMQDVDRGQGIIQSQKDGKYYYNMGADKQPLAVPQHLLPKRAQQPEKARGLTQ